MKEVVEERKAVEERKGRRYKEGDRMVEGRNFFGRVFWGENFYKRREERRCWNRGGRKLEEGVNSRGRITLIKQGSFYWVYLHVGSWARKPIGFLGPAGSTLVGRVDHPD